MDESAEVLARSIGVRVRQERQQRNWTLDQLAAEAGVSRRMLVNVEHGAVNPSIGTLLHLSRALDVGLPSLVEPPISHAVRRTPRGQGAVLWEGEFGGRGVLVASAQAPEVFELWEWTMGEGDRHASEAHSAGTRELVHVQEGQILIEVEAERYELHSGDALSFHGDLAHSYANVHTEPARFTLSVFEPGVGLAHRADSSRG